jgi:hypothetical protein
LPFLTSFIVISNPRPLRLDETDRNGKTFHLCNTKDREKWAVVGEEERFTICRWMRNDERSFKCKALHSDKL